MALPGPQVVGKVLGAATGVAGPVVTDARRQARRQVHALRERVGGPPPGIRDHLAEHPGAVHVNLGAGGALLDGWLNTDRDPAPGAQALDITRRFPLPDASVDRILAEHVIEHVSLEQGRALLQECARVLKTGGRVRISTPDLAQLASLATGRSLDAQAARYATWAAEAFTPGQQATMGARVLNNAMRNWDHRFLHDENTLTRALTDAGFTETERHLYASSDDPVFADAEGRGIDPTGVEMRTWETLALEARKP